LDQRISKGVLEEFLNELSPHSFFSSIFPINFLCFKGALKFLRNFSYMLLWIVGKQREESYEMFSYGSISQENKHEVRPLGKIPLCARAC
jgi:hypothetical protein